MFQTRMNWPLLRHVVGVPSSLKDTFSGLFFDIGGLCSLVDLGARLVDLGASLYCAYPMT